MSDEWTGKVRPDDAAPEGDGLEAGEATSPLVTGRPGRLAPGATGSSPGPSPTGEGAVPSGTGAGTAEAGTETTPRGAGTTLSGAVTTLLETGRSGLGRLTRPLLSGRPGRPARPSAGAEDTGTTASMPVAVPALRDSRPTWGDTAPAAPDGGAGHEAVDTFAGIPDEPERRVGWGKALVSVAGLLALLGVLYVGLAYWAGSHVPQGTRVEGVDVGGATKEDALARLHSRFDPAMTSPITVEADGTKAGVDPRAAGFGVDLESTLDGVTGVSFSPKVVWQRLTGNGEERTLRVLQDRDRLRAELGKAAETFRVDPKPGSVDLAQGAVSTTPATAGTELDVDATADAIGREWPSQRAVSATLRPVEPPVAQAEIDRFVKETANTVVSAPVKLKVGDKTATLDRAAITEVTSVETKDGTLSLKVDETDLLKAVRKAAPGGETPAKDAGVALKDGKPSITPEKTGNKIDPASLVQVFTTAVTATDTREGTVGLIPQQPATTAKQLEGMNLSTPMSEFRSRFPGGAENEGRTHNISVGLQHVNGTVVQPGKQFSLLAALGAMDASQGYVDAGVIINGMPAEAMAGGLSQVSTVLYNAAYFAGVQLDAHTAHSYYISRYPAGREATIWSGQIDNTWTNDTPAPVVIEAGIEGDEVVMRFWGQKVYDVESVSGPRENVTPPTKKTNPAANCQRSHGTESGFTITVTRVLSKGGQEVRREPVTTTYIPSDDVTCTNPEAPGYGK